MYHNRLVKDFYQEFLNFNFPNLISSNSTDNFITTLASAAPDQTILMKSTYNHSVLQTSNYFNGNDRYSNLQPVIDFKNCFAHTHGKPSEQRLASFSEGNMFCYAFKAADQSSSLQFYSDSHVFTFLELLKSSMIALNWRAVIKYFSFNNCSSELSK